MADKLPISTDLIDDLFNRGGLESGGVAAIVAAIIRLEARVEGVVPDENVADLLRHLPGVEAAEFTPDGVADN